MSSGALSGIERAIFGNVSEDQIWTWLDDHVRARLSTGLADVTFHAGRIAAVYGLRLTDGSAVVLKVHRDPVDVEHLVLASACQRLLSAAGYPCPTPLDVPAVTAGRTAAIETLLDVGERGDGHDPIVRRALAVSLAEQVDLLQSVPAGVLGPGAPAWTKYENGPWPTPHDPIFDFAVRDNDFKWLDELAQQASESLVAAGPPDVVGHCDWECENTRFEGDRLVATYDWDSVGGQTEPALCGFSAGGHTLGGIVGGAPTPDQVAAFLAAYDEARPARFSGAQQAICAAAATWVLAYNARCEVSGLAHGGQARDGLALDLLERFRGEYLQLRW